jgi:uncharacterized protein (TIGR00661 family)
MYGVCSWGLGHATRSLPVIRRLISDGNNITIISNGRALELLKKELNDSAEYIDIPDYPMLISENSRKLIAKSLIYWPLFIHKMQAGFTRATNILKSRDYNLVISDGRYDIYNKTIPSFFISHQMRIMNPLRMKSIEYCSEIFNQFFFKKFKGFIVPDFKDDSLSGDLSHNLKKIDENKINYVGVLSDFQKKEKKKDIDYLISITGPEPQRSCFEKKMLNQIKYLDGNVVVTLGKSESIKTEFESNVKFFSYLDRNEREDLLNRSKIVISRSGYSTILDLAVIGSKALMCPTPGQVEQEYLAEYHNGKGNFYCVTQDRINLKVDIKKTLQTTGIKRECNVDKSIEDILRIINS